MEAGNCTDDLDYLLTSVVRAATNLRDENNRLKAENERHEKLLSEIMPELKKLREERLALKAAVRVLMLQSGILPHPQDKRPTTFETLPYTVVETIFSLAAAAEPTHQFDPSIQAGARSPWLQLMRWKIGLPLIHKTAFWPGMAILYSDIVLRRMGQVSALANTLRAADVRTGLGKLIKSIRWDSCIVASQCADVIREDMAYIFSQCPQLQSFSYHPHRNFPLRRELPDRDECEGFFNPMWFVVMPSTLSDPPLLQTSSISNLRSLDLSFGLDIDDDVMLTPLHNILVTLKRLESLILGPWPSNSSFPEEIMGMPEVSLPCLTDLRIFGPGGAAETYICSRWDAPQLTRLTIFISEWPSAQLMERFGKRLRYLHLYPNRGRVYNVLNQVWTFSSTLFTVCPRLEHLIVPEGQLLVNSPTLVHLDLWTQCGYRISSCQDKRQAETNRVWTVDPRSNAPSLRTVRSIFTWSGGGLVREVGSNTALSNADWPWICHPDLLAEGSDDVLYHRFPLGRVAQTVAALIPEDFWQMPLEEREFEASEDWQGVYGDLEELQQKIEEEREASERELAEREARGEETSNSGRSSDDSEEEKDGDVHLDEDAVAIGVNIDGMERTKETQDSWRGSVDVSEELEPEKEVQERDVKSESRQLVKASAEPFESVPEYPVEQLDRAAILAAFRRGRGKQSYDFV